MSMSIPKTKEEWEVYEKLYNQYNKLTDENDILNNLNAVCYS